MSNEAALVQFDAAAAVELAHERAGDGLLVAAEYTSEGFNLVYVADEALEEYGGIEGVWDVGKRVHGYVHLDFEERRLFEDLFPPVEDTYGFVTHTDRGPVARVVAEDEGIYLSFRAGVETGGIVDAVADVVREG